MTAHAQIDVDRGRTSPYPARKDKDSPASPALPPTSLSPAHIAEALVQSHDGGATLDLTHKNLTDVGESGAEQLATIGREDIVEDESSVLRCVDEMIGEILWRLNFEKELHWGIIDWRRYLWRSRSSRVSDI